MAKNKRRPPKQQARKSRAPKPQVRKSRAPKPQTPELQTPEPQATPKSQTWVLGSNPKAAPPIHSLLEVYRRRYQNGDRAALLHALDICLRCYQKPPDWVANKLLYAMAEWFSYRAKTLDEAFGVRRVGKHTDRRREREDLRPYIVAAVSHLVQGKPLNAGVFMRVAEEINKSLSYVSTVWYEDESADLKKVFSNFRISRRPRKNSTK